MSLTKFLGGIGVDYRGPDVGFNNLTQDTRSLQRGDVFFDVVGNRDNINQAVSLGASAIVSVLEGYIAISVPFISTPNARLVFAKACAAFFKDQPKTVVAVTGTNGKTSTVDFIRQLYQSLSVRAASLGTLGLKGVEASFPLPNLNTLDAYNFHKVLFDLANRDVRAVAFEASSHGLDQHRLDAVKVRYAAFTNLTQDHLDYHETMDHYFQAKARLFLEVMDPQGVAVINQDDSYGEELIRLCKEKNIKVFTYSLENASADLYGRIEQIHRSSLGVSFTAFNHSLTVNVPLVGLFQVANILAAIGIVLASQLCHLLDLKAGLEQLQSPRGRMEYVGVSVRGGDVFVDYAHTPDALKRALQSLRAHATGKVYVVFGCGGDRDRSKRPQMGQIAKEWASDVIVTDDNPRTENASDIRCQVMLGCPGAIEIGDREKAIQYAIGQLSRGDVALIAGKGHEQGQIVGGDVKPFCDKQVAEFYLKTLNNPSASHTTSEDAA